MTITLIDIATKLITITICILMTTSIQLNETKMNECVNNQSQFENENEETPLNMKHMNALDKLEYELEEHINTVSESLQLLRNKGHYMLQKYEMIDSKDKKEQVNELFELYKQTKEVIQKQQKTMDVYIEGLASIPNIKGLFKCPFENNESLFRTCSGWYAMNKYTTFFYYGRESFTDNWDINWSRHY